MTPKARARLTMSRAAPVAYRSPYPHSREPNCQVPNPIRLTCPIPSTSRYFMSATVPRGSARRRPRRSTV
ncbi:Uncharacterised protein [Mycobacterium tuberculosis]|nr:Uncharacterised protein [Mycobacterium tuberculosis]